MNWPGVCNINSSLNVRASFFCFLLHFLFAFAVSRNAPFDPSHRFVFFFAVRGSSEAYLHFFFSPPLFCGFVQRQPTGRVRLGRASAVTRACRGLTWWVAFLTPTALASFFLFSPPFGRDAAERPGRSPALPPLSIFKKKNKTKKRPSGVLVQ